tara:strand:+ start:3462 stop:4265 length:804 start_codon:yes stop_codon:yes gene_type:complete
MGAFFVGVICVLLPILSVEASDCVLPGGEWADVDYVYDGDTLRLSDGRKIRLLGVNTPELAQSKRWGGRASQALADDARVAVTEFFAESTRVRLVYDVERRDRYKRILAHVFNSQGDSLETFLLRQGLAFHIAIPPNLALAKCFALIAERARSKNLGVWSHSDWRPLQVQNFSSKETGFRRVRGRVETITKNGTWWLELDVPLVLKVTAADRAYFPDYDWAELLHKRIEVSGWLIYRSEQALTKQKKHAYKPYIMHLRTPYALRLLD